jgi:hypothetical protein
VIAFVAFALVALAFLAFGLGTLYGRIAESKRTVALETAIREHRDARGDDRCWLDDLALYAKLPEGTKDIDIRQCDPAEMRRNCERFIELRAYPGAYVSTQREVERLKLELDRLRAAIAENEIARPDIEEEIRRLRQLDDRESRAALQALLWATGHRFAIRASDLLPDPESLS